MNDVQENISRYIKLRGCFCECLRKTKEPLKLLQAVEELDGLIDYLGIFLEMNRFITSKDLKDEGKLEIGEEERLNEEELLRYICKSRSETLISFKESVDLLLYVLDTTAINSLLVSYKDVVRLYTNFKIRANSEMLWQDSDMLSELAAQFDECYGVLEEKDLDKYYLKACLELERKLKLPYRWERHVNLHERTLMEHEGIFNINQEKRHIIFNEMIDAEAFDVPDRTGEGFWKKVKRSLLPHDIHKISMPAPDKIYLTPDVDRYLFFRDLRINLARKWARTIPLSMNHFLIKFYNEPHYWDEKHMFLADMDYMRQGFAYFQYAMEFGKMSKYTSIIYRKAMNCFHRSKTMLPPELTHKLCGEKEYLQNNE